MGDNSDEQTKESSTRFGFIQEKNYQNLLCPEFSVRLDAAQNLSNNISSVDITSIDVPNFFQFAKPFLIEENFGVINFFFEAIDYIVTNYKSNLSNILHEFLEIMIPPLRDRRRAVRNLSSNLLIKYSAITESTSVLEHLIVIFYNQPAASQLEILDITNKILNVAILPEDFHEKIENLIENAILIVNMTVHAAASRLLFQIKEFHSQLFNSLPEEMKKLASTSESLQIETVRLPQTPTSALPPLKNRFQFKPPDTSSSKKRTDEFWYRSKPRFAKTAGFIINKNGQLSFNTAKQLPFLDNSRVSDNGDDAMFSSDEPINYEPIHIYDTIETTEENPETNDFIDFDNLPDPSNQQANQQNQQTNQELNQETNHKTKNNIQDPFDIYVEKNEMKNTEKCYDDQPIVLSNSILKDDYEQEEEKALSPLIEPSPPPFKSARPGIRRTSFDMHFQSPPQHQKIGTHKEIAPQKENSSFGQKEFAPSPRRDPPVHVKDFSIGILSNEPQFTEQPSPPKEPQTSRPKRSFKPHPPPLSIPENKLYPSPEELHIKKIRVGKAPRKQTRVMKPDLSVILNEMQSSSEWERQSEAISTISSLITSTPDFISTNLRILSFEMVPLCSSIRSALSKAALECLTTMATTFGNEMTSFFEAIVNDLLTILLSSKGFIARLASNCISEILRQVNRKKALDYLASDHKRRPGCCKALLSMCLEELCESCEDPTYLLPSIGILITDANPESRKHAREACKKLNNQFPNFASIVTNFSFDDSCKKAISSAISEK
ncbi:hypothetical protein TRFO_30343 [Tritrichomonas foetus]|uniref:CLASP N-terminal domain-containing protein n=1 Tax=Tritrichomonas foetus TaxID=1144522 RepID=A0A1J4JYE1_9EUKA|nr:hypothetical protein TRFO_30343 [Tritrichomonas foetus]|eukprot:OHT02510.1 hypothetical protein TRFO_30343 [Tritrichomonas foetus]